MRKVLTKSFIITILCLLTASLMLLSGCNLFKSNADASSADVYALLNLDKNSIIGVWMVDPEYVKENSTTSGDETTEATEATEATSYEQNTFLIFSRENVEDGEENNVKVAKLKCGTAEYIGQYTVQDNEDGTKAVVVSISYFFSGNFTKSKLSGDLFFDRTLTLIDDNNNTIPLVSATLPDITVAVSKDFKVNEKLVGEWTDGEYGYVFKFNADGTVYVNLGGTASYEGSYVWDDEKITVTYIQTDEMKTEYTYSFIDEVLVIEGLGFTKVVEE